MTTRRDSRGSGAFFFNDRIVENIVTTRRDSRGSGGIVVVGLKLELYNYIRIYLLICIAKLGRDIGRVTLPDDPYPRYR